MLSPQTVPFRLHSTHSSGLGWWLTYWDAKFSGAEGTGLKVGPYLLNGAHLSKGETIFTGDNSAYLGSFYFYGTNAVAAFTKSTSLGGTLGEFKADAITLADGTTLEFRGTTEAVLAKGLNRGITVQSTGGRISVPKGKSLEVEWPIVCEGPLFKVGAGTLVLDSVIEIPDTNGGATSFTVSEGTVSFAESFVPHENVQIEVHANAAISVAACKEQSLGNICFEGGAIRVSYDETTEKSSVIVLGAGCAINEPIPVYPPSVRGIKVPFLKVPVSVRALTKDDFIKPLDLAVENLPWATFTVEIEGDYQVVYAQTCNLVTVVDRKPDTDEVNDRAYLTYGSESWRWSDNYVVHAGAEYFVGKGKTVYISGLSGEWVFPGESITFEGEGGTRAFWDFNDVNVEKITGDIRTYNYVRIFPNSTVGGELHLCGRLHVGSTEGSDNGLDFRAKTSMMTVIDSVVSGSGYMCFQANDNNMTNIYYFTADNTFTGTYFVYSSKNNTRTVIKFARAECFGPNPPSARAKNLLLQGKGSELYIEGSQSLNHPNREIAFYGNDPMLRVDEGEIFDMTCKLAFSRGKTAKKVGGGTWAVGGEVRREGDGAEPATLVVEEGFIRADKPKAFVNINVKIEEGSGIAAKYRPGETSDVANYGMMVTNSTRFVVSGETLKFKVSTEGKRVGGKERIAMMSVPEDVATAIDAKKIVVEHDDENGRYAVLEKDSVTISSVPYVRYSCRFTTGLKFILR